MSIDDVINALVLRSIHLSRICLKSNLESVSLGIFCERESQELWATELTSNFSLKISLTSSLRYLRRNWNVIRFFATKLMCLIKPQNSAFACISPPLLIWSVRFIMKSLKKLFFCFFSTHIIYWFKKIRALDALILFGFSFNIFSYFLFIEKPVSPAT